MKFVQKPNLTRTLMALEKGQTMFIPDKKFKRNVVRIAISRLRKTGASFTCSERGIVDGVNVCRL